MISVNHSKIMNIHSFINVFDNFLCFKLCTICLLTINRNRIHVNYNMNSQFIINFMFKSINHLVNFNHITIIPYLSMNRCQNSARAIVVNNQVMHSNNTFYFCDGTKYLMYAFPTETEKEAYSALEFVRELFKEDLIQSAFWHRFALTVHSPIAADPGRFGIVVDENRPRGKYVFRRNELGYYEEGAPDWDEIGGVLKLATFNFLEGRGLGRKAGYWCGLYRRR